MKEINFVEKFKRFCHKVDAPQIEKKYKVFDVRYNIHKRSLPVGLDKPVLWGLPEDEAKYLLTTLFKSRVTVDGEDRLVIYYDMVREDGVRSSVYDTPRGFVVQDSTNDKILNPRN